MRYIVNSANTVLAVSFGAEIRYSGKDCTAYTGTVPSGWNSLEEWYEDEGNKLWRWKIVGGNLTLDSSAVAPEEGRWGEPKLQDKTVTGPFLTQTTVQADTGYDALGSVVISAQPYWKLFDCESDGTMVVRNALVGEKSPKAVYVYFNSSHSLLSSNEIVSAYFLLSGNTITSCCVMISNGNGTFVENTVPSSWNFSITSAGVAQLWSPSWVGIFSTSGSYQSYLMY